ncbi:MAG: hypothetical protein ACXAAN_10735 [Candidatus Thorarchaeota archaeon]
MKVVLLSTLFLILVQSSSNCFAMAQIVNEDVLDLEVSLDFSNGEHLFVNSGFTWSEPAGSVVIGMTITAPECEITIAWLKIDDSTILNGSQWFLTTDQYTLSRETMEDDGDFRIEVFARGMHSITRLNYTDSVIGHLSLDRSVDVESRIDLIPIIGGAIVVIIIVIVLVKMRRN